MVSKAKYARRRRNAFLAAIVLAVVLIIVVILIIVSIAGGKKRGSSAKPLVSPTATYSTLTTIAPIDTDEPSDEPSTSPSTSPSEEPENAKMYVTGEDVNARKEPKTGDNVIKTLKKGTAVTPIEKDGDFWKVTLSDGTSCYVSAKFLSSSTPSTSTATATASASPTAAATPDTSNGKTMYVTADDVNVRKAASSTADRLTRLNKNAKVTAYAANNGWTYIQYSNGKYGYISSQYLKNEASSTASPSSKPTATATATAAPTPSHAASFSEIGIPSGIASELSKKSDFNTYLTMSKAGQTVGSPRTIDDKKFYTVSTTDGGVFYIIYKESEPGVYSEVSFSKQL